MSSLSPTSTRKLLFDAVHAMIPSTDQSRVLWTGKNSDETKVEDNHAEELRHPFLENVEHLLAIELNLGTLIACVGDGPIGLQFRQVSPSKLSDSTEALLAVRSELQKRH